MAGQHPTDLGVAAITPQPLAATEVGDLVRRVSAAIKRSAPPRAGAPARWSPSAESLLAAQRAAMASADIIARGNQADEPARAGDARCAARYAHLWGCPVKVAADEFGVGLGAVIRAWCALYPGEPTPLDVRGGR